LSEKTSENSSPHTVRVTIVMLKASTRLYNTMKQSVDAFLRSSRQALMRGLLHESEEHIQSSGTRPRSVVNLVMGNQAGDLDSMVCAVTYSFFLYRRRTLTCFTHRRGLNGDAGDGDNTSAICAFDRSSTGRHDAGKGAPPSCYTDKGDCNCECNCHTHSYNNCTAFCALNTTHFNVGVNDHEDHAEYECEYDLPLLNIHRRDFELRPEGWAVIRQFVLQTETLLYHLSIASLLSPFFPSRFTRECEDSHQQ